MGNTGYFWNMLWKILLEILIPEINKNVDPKPSSQKKVIESAKEDNTNLNIPPKPISTQEITKMKGSYNKETGKKYRNFFQFLLQSHI